MEVKNEKANNLCTALDLAIRDLEVGKDDSKFGYEISGKSYQNYMSNQYWDSYKENHQQQFKQQFKDGNGGEIQENGLVPPKMASFGSSSRFIYELSKDIPGFTFENKLHTHVGGVANLDGFLQKGNHYIYVEAKRREIYDSPHKNEKIKRVYIPVYKKIIEVCGEDKFHIEPKEYEEQDQKKITFYINNKPAQFFDLKQLICHFLGITYDIAFNNIQNAEVTFLYLIYNPTEVFDYIDEMYKDNIIDRYEEAKQFIESSLDVIPSIFQAVLKYQIEASPQKLANIDISFDFKLVDQATYKQAIESIR